MNRDSEIYYARVMLRECIARRHQRKFAHRLLDCAIKATNRALKLQPQPDLFGGKP